MSFLAPADQTAQLREALQQSELSGASRRALLLRTDRLPPTLARPHHLRLAREALKSLAGADRAQVFELSRGRVAIVWRGRGMKELSSAMDALGHLLADQPDGQAPSLHELVALYDLPDQAVWLLDELAEEPSSRAPGPSLKLDVKQLAGLEVALAQADLAPFARWRAVMRLSADGPAAAPLARIKTEPAWEERYFAAHEIAAHLCPDCNIKADPWLFRRLTRVLDRRMLALLGVPRTLAGLSTFALPMNVETILSAEFLRFDDALPVPLRGAAMLMLRPADILADPGAFLFARNFARARGYRLALAGATLKLLKLLDARAAGFDAILMKLASQGQAARGDLPVVAAEFPLVVTGLDRASDVRWAVASGITLGQGRAVV